MSANLLTGPDFFVLAGIGHGERDANRVADPAADELFEGDPCFDDSLGRSALGYAQVQGNLWPLGGKPPVDLDTGRV